MILMPYGIAGAYYRLLHYPYRHRLLGRGASQSPAEANADTFPPNTDMPKEVAGN
jgi:hypothetical protein